MIQRSSGAPIPLFPVRFPLISSLFFEIDQGYLYVFCTFRHDLSIGAIKTEFLRCHFFDVRVPMSQKTHWDFLRVLTIHDRIHFRRNSNEVLLNSPWSSVFKFTENIIAII